MSKKSSNRNNVILKNVHCPYCNTDEAVLINKETANKYSLQLPAFGLKFMLSVLYLGFIHIYRYGCKLIQIVKKNDNLTYCFCPKCGNSYSLNAPAEIINENEDKKLYKIEHGKLLQGICKGISVLTEIPLLWIRIMTTIYGIIEVFYLYSFFEGVKYYIFSPSRALDYFYIPLSFIVSIAIVFGEYFLFSLLLKTKVTEDEE
ncbi:MAG: hypothetical protein ACI4JB_06680 [Porcipelethomonas sp.]